jgi:hypothetical protein
MKRENTMSTTTLTPDKEQRVASVVPAVGAALPTKVRASFARLCGRFGSVRNSAWAFTVQTEHMLAYETWDETCAIDEERE